MSIVNVWDYKLTERGEPICPWCGEAQAARHRHEPALHCWSCAKRMNPKTVTPEEFFERFLATMADYERMQDELTTATRQLTSERAECAKAKGDLLTALAQRDEARRLMRTANPKVMGVSAQGENHA